MSIHCGECHLKYIYRIILYTPYAHLFYVCECAFVRASYVFYVRECLKRQNDDFHSKVN